MAPRRRACYCLATVLHATTTIFEERTAAIALSPATPAPITNTLLGGICGGCEQSILPNEFTRTEPFCTVAVSTKISTNESTNLPCCGHLTSQETTERVGCF